MAANAWMVSQKGVSMPESKPMTSNQIRDLLRRDSPSGIPHLVSIKGLNREAIEGILGEAGKLLAFKEGFNMWPSSPSLSGKILATIFFEPSTRTRLSFEGAMLRLGGGVISTEDVNFSSVVKGESLQDTIRVMSAYGDVIVIRHPKKGSAKIASEFSIVPVISAGDGIGEHPTQTLVDLFTILKIMGRIDGVRIAMIGDLKYGRTVHSLAYALSLFNDVEIIFIAPKTIQIPKDIQEDLVQKGMNIHLGDSLKDAYDADVVYDTRIQKERFKDRNPLVSIFRRIQYERLKGRYIIDERFLENANPNIKIMHPLPRVNEISTAIDHKVQAVYFDQADYGVPVRMALLNIMLGE